MIEEPCSKLEGVFDRREVIHFFDSLANPAASYGECARWCGSIEDAKQRLKGELGLKMKGG